LFLGDGKWVTMALVSDRFQEMAADALQLIRMSCHFPSGPYMIMMTMKRSFVMNELFGPKYESILLSNFLIYFKVMHQNRMAEKRTGMNGLGFLRWLYFNMIVLSSMGIR
jgi:hypothetical protein